MAYTPTSIGVRLGGNASSGTVDDRELGQRAKMLTQLLPPYMAQRPDIIMSMAQSGQDTESLVSSAGQIYAMHAGNQLADQLRGLSPATQRSIMSRLSPGQQAALGSMGFQTPQRDESSLLGDAFGIIAKPLSIISHGAAAIPGVKPAFDATFEGLSWIGSQPGHFYRALALGSGNSQAAGLLGGLAGAAAVALAVPTGGSSLMALGALGLGALGGASVAAAGETAIEGQFDSSALTNPGDWFRAFNASWNGEKTFRPSAISHADTLLADPRMSGLAQDLAAAGVNVVDLAHEVAGHRGLDQNSQMREMEKLAGTMAAPGSPQFRTAMTSMLNALDDPTFQEAVQTLNNGKISVGRDFAGAIGLDSGTPLYNLISGGTDALFTIAVDPTLMLGAGSKMIKAKRYSFEVLNGAEAASSFRKFVIDRPAIHNTYIALADAVQHSESGGIQLLRQRIPQLEPMYGDLVQYKQALRDTGRSADAIFSSDDVLNYLTSQSNLRPILEGAGSVKNGRKLQLYTVSAPRAAFREFRGDVRSLVNGMADISTEAKWRKLAEKHNVPMHEVVLQQVKELAARRGWDYEELLPTLRSDAITEDGLIVKPWLTQAEVNPNAYATGRAFAGFARQVPIVGRSVGRIGEAITSMTTMSIEGKAVSLVGKSAPKEIRALSELGRYMGMPSYFRKAWADVILSSDSPAARYDAVHGWMANMMRLTGIDSTDEGRELVNRYLDASKKLYGTSDTIMVNGHQMNAGIFLSEQADKIVMPDLHELRKAAVTGGLGKVMGIADLPVINAAVNKIWKPLVLLRLGFIPRAAGEELASFVLRGGIGSLTQEFGGRYLGKIQALEGALRKQAIARATGVAADLSSAEVRLLEQGVYGVLPAHTKPLLRMMNRAKGDPFESKIVTTYGNWLREHLTEGLGKQGLAYGVADETGVVRTARELRDLQRTGALPLAPPQLARLNVADYKDAILLGNRYSIRRMLLGGVNNDLVEAGRQWSALHSTTVMRELSSTGAGAVDPGYPTDKLLPGGDSNRPIVVTERGVRRTMARGDDGFAGAILDHVQRSLADPAFRADALEHLSRVSAGTAVNEAQLGSAADRLFALGRNGTEQVGHMGASVEGAQARLITRELIGAHFDRDQWNHMLTELRRAPGGSVTAQSLEAYLKGVETPTIDTITGALRNAVTDLPAGDPARVQLTRLHAELGKAKPVTQWLDTLPLADRQFAAQFLDGQMLSGNNSFWATHRAQGANAPEKWLYGGLSEARQARVESLRAKVLDPRYHDRGVTKSLRLPVRDDAGQFVDTQLRQATVMLYEAPQLPQAATFEEVLSHATNRQLLLDNQGIVQKVLQADPRDVSLVADYRLADEMQRINARMAGLGPEAASRPRMMRQDRKVTDGRVHDLLIPDADTATREGTALWSYPRQIADKHLVATPDAAFNPADAWARDMVGRHDDLVRRANRQTVRVRTRKGNNGEDIPLVYHYSRHGRLTPVDPTKDIPIGETATFLDVHGKPIHYGDTTFFTQALRETGGAPSEEVMWEMLGPSMRDAWADSHAATRVRNKRTNASWTLPGRPQQSSELEALLRAHVDDVKRVPLDDLPGHAVGEIETYRTVGTFEQMVRYGFDNIIGPSIDAIIRRPMAFHHFANRYVQTKNALAWTLDPELIGKMGDIIGGYSDAVHSASLNPETLADAARAIHTYQGESTAAKWSNEEALAWLRGHTEGELADLLTATITTASHDPSQSAAAVSKVARQLEGVDYRTLSAASAVGRDPVAAIDAIEAALPPRALESAAALNSAGARRAIEADPLLRYIDDNQAWDTVLAARNNLTHQRSTAGEIAASAAIADALPFIDSHHFKTQFGDYAKGYMPFWYAEENFMKRWARGLADEGPALIRKAQLTYMGIKSAGIIRTDQNGRDWFVYPGSGLLADVLSRIPGLSAMHNAGMMFQTPTDQMLPGLNNRFGAPSFNPLVTLPMEVIASRLPEMQPVERAILGDFASGRTIIDQVMPSTVRNLYGVLFQDENSNTRMASAMNAAIAFAEAHGQGPGDDATPSEIEHFMDRVSSQARIIVLAQAIGGFVTPGSPSLLLTGQSGNVTGLGADNPAEYLSAEYMTLVRTLGIEAGTARYLELNKNNTIDDVVNPLSYTVPRNVSTTGAPMPSTEQTASFMRDNANYFAEFPNAAPWLIPQNYDAGVERSQYAFDQQVIEGLRHQRTPDEFYTAIKFKQGAQDYFATRDAYLAAIEQATNNGNKPGADALRADMDWKLNVYRVAHPLFADQLQSDDGRLRRDKVLKEMRIVVDDPQHPKTPQFDALRTAVHVFDAYRARLAVLSNDHSMQSRREVDFLKQQYGTFMDTLVSANPAISSFWSGVLKPEASF